MNQTEDGPFLPPPLTQVISSYCFCSAVCVLLLRQFTGYMKNCLLKNKYIFLIIIFNSRATAHCSQTVEIMQMQEKVAPQSVLPLERQIIIQHQGL